MLEAFFGLFMVVKLEESLQFECSSLVEGAVPFLSLVSTCLQKQYFIALFVYILYSSTGHVETCMTMNAVLGMIFCYVNFVCVKKLHDSSYVCLVLS